MAKKKKTSPGSSKRKPTNDDAAKMQLIVSDDETPSIRLKPGMKFEVVSVSVVEGDTLKPTRVGARLCGGTSTCLALVDIDTKSQPGP
jgi:hypothetical protein